MPASSSSNAIFVCVPHSRVTLEKRLKDIKIYGFVVYSLAQELKIEKKLCGMVRHLC
jgi:hypothetical protein